MTFQNLKSEAEYKAALKEVAVLMEQDPELGTPEGDRLDDLVECVQNYEATTMHMGGDSVVCKKPHAQ